MTRFRFLATFRPGIGALAALACAAPAAAAFQAQETNTVGPAEIRDFSLPGSRPAQPEPEPTIAPVMPPAAEPQPEAAQPEPPAAAETPAPVQRQAPVAPAPVSRAPARTAPAAPPVREAAPAPAAGLPQPEALREALPTAPATPAPEFAAPAPVTEAPQAAEALPEPEGGFPWLPLLLGAALAALGFAGWQKLRKAGLGKASESFALAGAAPAPEPSKLPAPEAEPAPAETERPAAGGIGIVMRPWLELEFRPDRATATADGAGVQYEVIIRNVGNAPARNVRLAARMFNAGPQLDKEIAAFYARGIDDGGAAPLTLLPRTEVKIQSSVTMPRTEMREIKVQGRSLFIPTVAFNLLYNWGRDKTGQTCSSHIVGREPETPSQKMAPFRLDLGPRVYRSVGQRPSALARAV